MTSTTSPIALAALLITILVFWITRTKKNQSVPRAGWEIGTLNSRLGYILKLRMDLYHQEMHAKYGPIFEIASSSGPKVFLADPDEAKRVLSNQEDFTLNPELSIVGEGLIECSLISLATGPDWKRHRAAIQPAFSPTHLRHASKVSIQMANELGDYVLRKIEESSAKCHSIELYSTCNSLILDIMGLVMFSEKFGALDLLDNPEQKLKVFGSPEKNFLATFAWRILVPKPLWWLFGLGNGQPSVKSVREKYVKFMMNIVSKVSKSTATMEDSDSRIGTDLNFIERMLKTTDIGTLSLDEIVSEAIVMFLAGQDTTATLLASTIASLAQNPHIQDRLYTEIQDVSLDPSSINTQTLANCPYLENVIKESLRVNSGVPATERLVIRDTEILGHKIQKGSKVYCSLNCINQSAEYEDPHQFLPDRWDHAHNPNAFLPFGGGNRVCIGKKMAVSETKFALVRLMQLFKFGWDPTSQVRVISLITTVKAGMKVILTRR